MSKRAFTLIELLVVIAIIAILAAILFPVFAQAKSAAKGAASISNVKQAGTATFMYMQDNDDIAPMLNSWQADAPVFVGGCGVVSWAQAQMPYMKNGDLLNDPLAVNEVVPAGWPPQVRNAIFPEFGYNHVVWSPVQGGGGTCASPWANNPISQTSVGRVADIPMFVSKPYSVEESGSGVLWWYGAGTILSSLLVDPPDCNTIVPWCFGNWGNGGNWSLILNAPGGTVENGRYTGGNSRRRANNHVIFFGDGHGKTMKPGQLAVGTNWVDNTTFNSGSLVVQNQTIYRWNKN